MTVKTLPGDKEKIERIQSLVEKHVNVNRLMGKIGFHAGKRNGA